MLLFIIGGLFCDKREKVRNQESTVTNIDSLAFSPNICYRYLPIILFDYLNLCQQTMSVVRFGAIESLCLFSLLMESCKVIEERFPVTVDGGKTVL